MTTGRLKSFRLAKMTSQIKRTSLPEKLGQPEPSTRASSGPRLLNHPLFRWYFSLNNDLKSKVKKDYESFISMTAIEQFNSKIINKDRFIEINTNGGWQKFVDTAIKIKNEQIFAENEGNLNADKFNKNAADFAKSPFTKPEPTAIGHLLEKRQIPNEKGKQKAEQIRTSKLEEQKVNRPTSKARPPEAKVTADGGDQPHNRDVVPLVPLSGGINPPDSFDESESSSDSKDDESSSESGLEPLTMAPFSVPVAKHVPMLMDIFVNAGAVKSMLTLTYEVIYYYGVCFYLGKFLGQIKAKPDVAYRALIDCVWHLITRWAFKALLGWLMRNFSVVYLTKLQKKSKHSFVMQPGGRPTKISQFKQIIDNSQSVDRHPQHQITDKIETKFIYYEYVFTRQFNLGNCVPYVNFLVVKPISKFLRYYYNDPLGYNWRLKDAYEIKFSPASIDFPQDFEKYVDYETDTPMYSNQIHNPILITHKRAAKIEVVHVDLLHRIWNASTFNLINGVEQLHSRVSNVINSSNDFVMFRKEAKNSAIGGTKNLMCYMIQARYDKDPYKHFHKGSPEYSNMGIECSSFRADGDPRYLLARRWILGYVMLNASVNGLNELNQCKSHLESIVQNSLYLTQTFSIPLGPYTVKLKDPMQKFLFSVRERLVVILCWAVGLGLYCF